MIKKKWIKVALGVMVSALTGVWVRYNATISGVLGKLWPGSTAVSDGVSVLGSR